MENNQFELVINDDTALEHSLEYKNIADYAVFGRGLKLSWRNPYLCRQRRG